MLKIFCRKILFSPLCIFILTGSLSFANSKSIEAPISLQEICQPLTATEQLAPLDIMSLIAEDELNQNTNGIAPRYGIPIDVTFDLANSGLWETLDDGRKIWRLEIISNEAKSLSILFNKFWLPNGAKLFVYNENYKIIYGPFTSKNNKSHRTFATPPYPGEALILELNLPADVSFPGEISISSITIGYVDIFNDDNLNSTYTTIDPCYNFNASCDEAIDWQDEKRAVVKTFSPSGFYCTGTLLTETNESMLPYILTASHCLKGDEKNWTFLFNLESPTCSTSSPLNLSSCYGSTVLTSSWENGDIALLLLDNIPPDSFNVYYAGWTTDNSAVTSGVGIHHPGGGLKKILFENDPIRSSTLGFTGGELITWSIDEIDQGYIIGGSSGSPLFNQDHKVVGPLYGGLLGCINGRSAVYPKLSESWDKLDNNSHSAKEWLDSENTGLLSTEGLDGGVISISADTIIGKAPLTVNFTASSTLSAESWSWDFGEGGTSGLQSPSYIFTQTGSYTVSAVISSNGKSYKKIKTNYITIIADTLIGNSSEVVPGKSFKLVLYANNSSKVDQFTIPLEFGGNPFTLKYDSFSTVGCRTEYFEVQDVIHFDPWFKRLSIQLKSSRIGLFSELAPGAGAILNVYFTIDSTANPLEQAFIEIDGYSSYPAQFTNYFTSYQPTTSSVKLTIAESCCIGIRGNVNNDVLDLIDISDFVFLVAYSFQSGPAPTCFEEADINGSGTLDVSDLIRLVSYAFGQLAGQLPDSCTSN